MAPFVQIWSNENFSKKPGSVRFLPITEPHAQNQEKFNTRSLRQNENRQTMDR